MLKLGNFELVGGGFDADYQVETIAEGMNFGNAEGRDVIVQTLLQDGAAVSRDGYDNRVVTFGVLITAADSLGLANGEAALAAEIGKRNELVWQPPDQWGPPSVYVVVMSSMEFEFDDWGEMQPGTVGRRFMLTLTCKPFARSLEPVVIEAVGSGETPPVENTVVVDNCSSATNWSASPGSTVSAVGGRLRGVGTNVFQVILTRTGTVDMTGTPLMAIDYLLESASTHPSARLTVQFDSTGWLAPIASGPSPVAGLQRSWFQFPFDAIPTGVFTSFAVSISVGGLPVFIQRVIELDQVIRTNVNPSTGSGRQQFRSLIVTGSARTEGSLQIAHETSSLGDVLVYTNVDDGSGAQPSCRPYRTSGNATPTPDSSTASGAWEPLNGGAPVVFDVPARTVTEATYSFVGRMKATAAGFKSLTLSRCVLVGASELAAESTTLSMELGTGYSFVPLGAAPLPTTALPVGSEAFVRLKLSSPDAVQLDDLYLCNLTTGAMTLVSCGTGAPAAGGSSNRLWIDTASLDVPRPSMWVGTQADRSDARHVHGSAITSEMPHRFPPGDVNLFTVTSNALYAAASLEFYSNWHSNAAA